MLIYYRILLQFNAKRKIWFGRILFEVNLLSLSQINCILPNLHTLILHHKDKKTVPYTVLYLYWLDTFTFYWLKAFDIALRNVCRVFLKIYSIVQISKKKLLFFQIIFLRENSHEICENMHWLSPYFWH